MKVAFFTYPAAFQNVGGGEILLLKLKEYLEKDGVQVDFFDSWHSKIEEYDLLHVFGSVKDCLGLIRVANARKVRVVITPLLWSDWKRGIFGDASLRTKTDFALRHTLKVLWPSFPSSRREMLVRSDLIFPNSEIEKKQTARLFAISAHKMRVVPNGVDADFVKAAPKLFRAQYGHEPFILGVGRIEPRKNQLALIRAVKSLPGKKLVLIGSPVSGYEDYFRQCKAEGNGFVTFMPTLPHSGDVLKSAYAACDLFVFPAWFETPGLAALEAALAGAKVLVTKGGSTREYFLDYAPYLDPANPRQIAEQITQCLKNPLDNRLKRHILEHYTWEAVAKQQRQHYQKCLESGVLGSTF